ncbi:hypothetical protein NNJEOMEG_00074 [Fundidesulfovibrio magnetotacticus]|uniref:Peptidase C14 caspase domain-containing protein n=1 Tax=Fundidesulfovibrio magnetotacticus TaxID=2730080 RepID=A0A6V8LHR0_9BACT|nr:caspase family protein [Fundidesulfovibrio magnetotacticus]GFK92252.1 hypothetical protein NNJEOMEG_00074 [Fundidesulfovibrio magnetotacticus]
MRRTSCRSLVRLNRMACFAVLALVLLTPLAAHAGVIIQSKDGSDAVTYAGSHALLIGQAAYKGGWARLDSVAAELEQVGEALKRQDFQVETLKDADAATLRAKIKDFIDRNGYTKDNRLLLYYSGHGYSRNNNQMGYIVPVDAPLPEKDERGFLSKAVSMNQVQTWCREMEARHVLFVFDSCFSGTIFKSRASGLMRDVISQKVSRPVRQFITAGSASETVPGKSVFTPFFVRGIDGAADLDKDGYVTAAELGIYLQKEVPEAFRGQTPQYGKLQDPDFDEGEFVFAPESLRGQVEQQKKYYREFLQRQAEQLAIYNCKWMIAGLIYGFDRWHKDYLFEPESDFGEMARAAFNLKGFVRDQLIYDPEKGVAYCSGHVVLPDKIGHNYKDGRVDGIGLGTARTEMMYKINAMKVAVQGAYWEALEAVGKINANFYWLDHSAPVFDEKSNLLNDIAQNLGRFQVVPGESWKELRSLYIAACFGLTLDARPDLCYRGHGALEEVLKEQQTAYGSYWDAMRDINKMVSGARIPPYVLGIHMRDFDIHAPNRTWGWDENGNTFMRLYVDLSSLKSRFGEDVTEALWSAKESSLVEVVGRGANSD